MSVVLLIGGFDPLAEWHAKIKQPGCVFETEDKINQNISSANIRGFVCVCVLTQLCVKRSLKFRFNKVSGKSLGKTY